MRIKLDQKLIDRGLTVPDGKKQIERCDTEVPGLYVLTSKTSEGKGTYYLRYKVAGKTKHKKIALTTELTLKDARNLAKQLKLDISQGGDPQARIKEKRSTMLYSTFMEEHYFPYVTPRLRDAKGYKQRYEKHLKTAFGDYRVSEISKQMVQSFHDDLHNKKGLSKATANRYLQLIKTSLNHGINMEILDLKRNPAVGIPLFQEQGRERYLSQDELSRLIPVLMADDGQVAKISRFLLATGLRRGECLNCRWEHIDLDNRVMVIPSASAKSKKTDSIPLNEAAIQVLRECDRDSSPFPFVNKATNKPYATLNKKFQALMKQAGLEGVTAHTLRHTAASMMINAGRSLYDVQKVLRHSSSTVTEKYAHLSSQSTMAASDTISEQLRRAAAGDR